MSYRAAIIADMPVAYWPMDDPIGSATILDVSGSGYNLTPNATGVTLASPAALFEGGGTQGIALDGVSGFLTAPAGLSSFINAGKSFTAEIWLTLTTAANSGSNRVFATDGPTSSPFDGWDGRIKNDGTQILSDQGNGTAATTGSVSLSPGEALLQPWHIVWTFTPAAQKIYSNGVLKNTTSSPVMVSGRDQLAIGYNPATNLNFLQATLQHAAIYPYELSASQIATHFSVGLAGDASFSSPNLQGFKQQIVQVLSPAGVFIDVWRDAPLLAGVKFAVDSATQPLQVTLPRSFDDFDEAGTPGAIGTIAQGNIVQYYLFGPGLPSSGLLKYQGVIDSYAPAITEAGEEGLTVTITPFDSVVADNSIQNIVQSFGTPGSTGTYVDPLTMFDYWFSHTDAISGLNYTSPLTLNGGNPGSSGNSAQYTFQNQRLDSIFNTVMQMLPANWYWRVNADKTVTRNVTPATAQHMFTIGQHIVAPQYRKDWTKLKNVAQVIGSGLSTSLTTALVSGTNYTTLAVKAIPANVVSGQQLLINDGGNPVQLVTLSAGASQGATSLSVTSFTANGTYPIDTQITILISSIKQGSDLTTFGKRVIQVADNRVLDQNTAGTLAQGLLNANDQMLLRTKIRVIDYRGDSQTGIGYDVETIAPGDSCQIINPGNSAASNLWDVVQWDQAFWDYSPAASLQQVAIIVSMTYGWDYVDLELASAQPSQDRDVLALQIDFQDFSLV